MKDIEKKTEVIGTLFSAYGQGGDGKRIAIYTMMLKSLPLDILKKTCQKIILEQHFMPAVSDILEAARQVAALDDDTKRVKDFDEAWREIISCVKSGHQDWSTPEIAETVKNFGWRELLYMEESQETAIRAQLRSMYETVCRRKVTDSNNRYITGTAKELLPSGKIKSITAGKSF